MSIFESAGQAQADFDLLFNGDNNAAVQLFGLEQVDEHSTGSSFSTGADSSSVHSTESLLSRPFNELNDQEKQDVMADYLDINPTFLGNILKDKSKMSSIIKTFPKEIADLVKDFSVEHPDLLGQCLETVDNNDKLFKLLQKHKPIVGSFLEQHKNMDVLAEFLAKYPTALHHILDEERSIIENFLRDEPEALYIYLDAKAEVLRSYFQDRPHRFPRYVTDDPQLFSNFCDNHPKFLAAWLQNRPNVIQDYLVANPALFWNHLAAHPSCVSSGQTPFGLKFTMSLLHDIPQDQQHLIRLPITWSLPKDSAAREEMLKQAANRGETEVAIQGSDNIGDAWISHERFTAAELQQLTGEDEDWLNGGDTQIPKPLEWCAGRNLIVKGAKKNHKVPKPGKYQKAFESIFKEIQPSLRQESPVQDDFSYLEQYNLTPPLQDIQDLTPNHSLYTEIDGNRSPSLFQSVDAEDLFDMAQDEPDSSDSDMPIIHSQRYAAYRLTQCNVAEPEYDSTEIASDNNGENEQEDAMDYLDESSSSSSEDNDDENDGNWGDDDDFKPAASGTSQRKGRSSIGHMSIGRQHTSGKSIRRPAPKSAVVESDTDTESEYDQDTEHDDCDTNKPRPSTVRNTTAAPAPPRAFVPYPAPAHALRQDDQKRRSARAWSLREEDCAIKHMLRIRDQDRIHGEARFREAARRVNIEMGTKRTQISFKNFWNRTGRARSGFDERRNKAAPLATSQQGRYAPSQQ